MSAKIVLWESNNTRLEAFNSVASEDIQITWVDSTQRIDRQADQLKDAVAVIAPSSGFPVDVAQVCPNLKLVQTTSAGTNRFDVQGLGELGIRVANNGGGNSVAVAEHAIALILSVYRNFQLQFQSVTARRWAGELRAKWFHQAHELTGKTVGIIGLGHIGRQVARRLQGWDCKLVYYDVLKHPPELEQELHVVRVSLDELLRASDVVTLHVPLITNTRAMIGDREFDIMRPTAMLINASRGPVVDEAALIRALGEGKIAAAGLDVLEQEPPSADNPLLDMVNVVITPHSASFAQESGEKSRAFAIQNLARVLRGEEPQSVVLPE